MLKPESLNQFFEFHKKYLTSLKELSFQNKNFIRAIQALCSDFSLFENSKLSSKELYLINIYISSINFSDFENIKLVEFFNHFLKKKFEQSELSLFKKTNTNGFSRDDFFTHKASFIELLKYHSEVLYSFKESLPIEYADSIFESHFNLIDNILILINKNPNYFPEEKLRLYRITLSELNQYENFVTNADHARNELEKIFEFLEMKQWSIREIVEEHIEILKNRVESQYDKFHHQTLDALYGLIEYCDLDLFKQYKVHDSNLIIENYKKSVQNLTEASYPVDVENFYQKACEAAQSFKLLFKIFPDKYGDKQEKTGSVRKILSSKLLCRLTLPEVIKHHIFILKNFKYMLSEENYQFLKESVNFLSDVIENRMLFDMILTEKYRICLQELEDSRYLPCGGEIFFIKMKEAHQLAKECFSLFPLKKQKESTNMQEEKKVDVENKVKEKNNLTKDLSALTIHEVVEHHLFILKDFAGQLSSEDNQLFKESLDYLSNAIEKYDFMDVRFIRMNKFGPDGYIRKYRNCIQELENSRYFDDFGEEFLLKFKEAYQLAKEIFPLFQLKDKKDINKIKEHNMKAQENNKLDDESKKENEIPDWEKFKQLSLVQVLKYHKAFLNKLKINNFPTTTNLIDIILNNITDRRFTVVYSAETYKKEDEYKKIVFDLISTKELSNENLDKLLNSSLDCLGYFVYIFVLNKDYVKVTEETRQKVEEYEQFKKEYFDKIVSDSQNSFLGKKILLQEFELFDRYVNAKVEAFKNTALLEEVEKNFDVSKTEQLRTATADYLKSKALYESLHVPEVMEKFNQDFFDKMEQSKQKLELEYALHTVNFLNSSLKKEQVILPQKFLTEQLQKKGQIGIIKHVASKSDEEHSKDLEEELKKMQEKLDKAKNVSKSYMSSNLAEEIKNKYLNVNYDTNKNSSKGEDTDLLKKMQEGQVSGKFRIVNKMDIEESLLKKKILTNEMKLNKGVGLVRRNCIPVENSNKEIGHLKDVKK